MDVVVGTFSDNKAAMLVGVVVFMGIHILKKWSSTRRKSPPGLPSVPILGSLPWLPSNTTHLTFTHFAKKYGKIYSIDLGRQYAVVLNDYSSIHEALIQQALLFADRPQLYTSQLFNPGRKGFLDAHYDETFARNKQVSLKVLRDLGLGRNIMEERVLLEVTELLKNIEKHESNPFNAGQLLYASVSNIISSILFNKRFNVDDPRYCAALNTIQELSKLFAELTLAEFLPVMRYFPKARRDIHTTAKKMRDLGEFIDQELDEHHVSRDPNDHESDFIAAYKHKMADSLDSEWLKIMIMDFFAAGTDTTSNTLRWALIYMANNPDVQSRVQGEIDNVIGAGRSPAMTDRATLKYTEAVILEIYRMASSVPLALPHRLMADTELQGFFLQKGTVVYINTWAVQHDPDVWPDPERFDPARFLDDNGQVIGREKIILFGQGRRSCFGEVLARQEVFLYFTSILQRFQVLPDGNETLSEDGEFGIVLSPKPHQLVFQPR